MSVKSPGYVNGTIDGIAHSTIHVLERSGQIGREHNLKGIRVVTHFQIQVLIGLFDYKVDLKVEVAFVGTVIARMPIATCARGFAPMNSSTTCDYHFDTVYFQALLDSQQYVANYGITRTKNGIFVL